MDDRLFARIRAYARGDINMRISGYNHENSNRIGLEQQKSAAF